MSTKQPRPLTSELRHPQQPVGWDGAGVIRFKPNAIVQALLDDCRRLGGLDLNGIGIGVARGRYTNEDQIQLAQLIGYSVSGFGDLSYVPRSMVRQADRKAAKISTEREAAE